MDGGCPVEAVRLQQTDLMTGQTWSVAIPPSTSLASSSVLLAALYCTRDKRPDEAVGICPMSASLLKS